MIRIRRSMLKTFDEIAQSLPVKEIYRPQNTVKEVNPPYLPYFNKAHLFLNFAELLFEKNFILVIMTAAVVWDTKTRCKRCLDVKISVNYKIDDQKGDQVHQGQFLWPKK